MAACCFKFLASATFCSAIITKFSNSSTLSQFHLRSANASQYIRVRSITTPQVDSIDNNGAFKAAQYSGSLPFVGSGSFGGSFNGGVAATTAAQLMNESITATNVQGFAAADYQAAFALLANSDEYQFNVLLAPGVSLDNAASATDQSLYLTR